MTRYAWLVVVACYAPGGLACAEEPSLPLPQIEDLYKTDTAVSPLTLANGRGAIYVRQRVDQEKRVLKQSLWRMDEGEPRAMEAGEPDAFSPLLSPNGKWIAFLSTPLALGAVRGVSRARSGTEYGACLADTARLHAVFGALYALGIAL